MRISDWSSDVCSSDLIERDVIFDHRLVRVDEPCLLAGREPAVRGDARDRRGHRRRRFRRRDDELILRVDIAAAEPLRAVGANPFIAIRANPRPGAKGVEMPVRRDPQGPFRSEEHTSELQSLMRISSAVFCLKKKKSNTKYYTTHKLK